MFFQWVKNIFKKDGNSKVNVSLARKFPALIKGEVIEETKFMKCIDTSKYLEDKNPILNIRNNNV